MPMPEKKPRDAMHHGARGSFVRRRREPLDIREARLSESVRFLSEPALHDARLLVRSFFRTSVILLKGRVAPEREQLFAETIGCSSPFVFSSSHSFLFRVGCQRHPYHHVYSLPASGDGGRPSLLGWVHACSAFEQAA